MIRLIIALMLTGLIVAGCASRIEGVLQPVAVSGAGTSKVDLLVATTRQPSNDPATLFSGERGDELILTEIGVSIPPEKNRKVGEVQWPKRLPADPMRDFVTYMVEGLDGQNGVRQWANAHVPANGRAMIFVHGFNNTFEDSVYRYAQIIHDSGADVAPILFTWPSRASIFDYNYDKESTNYSRDSLEKVIRFTAANPKVKEITIMAHSMGTWLTVEALRQIAIRDGKLPSKVQQVILASPDLDVNVFEKQMRSLGKESPHFTIFVSRDDLALSISRRISGNVDRLGQIDPREDRYRQALESTGLITIVDLTKVKSDDSLNHGKFAQSPEVVRLIGQRLAAGQTVTDSDVGLGDRLGAVALGAAQGVGSAASLAVSAPIAIFDAETRRNYNRQIDRLGNSIEGTLQSATGN